MWGSTVFYLGLLLGIGGLGVTVRSIRKPGPGRRRSAIGIVVAGFALAVTGLLLPARASRAAARGTKLDDFVPAWQFSEAHSLRVAADPDRVFAAIRQVRAGEILLFRTLTWIRRGGRSAPPGILNAGDDRPILDVATTSGFVPLADEEPRELVIGTIVVRPPGLRAALSPDLFRRPLPPGHALAVMNFRVVPDGAGGSIVSTETRVFANDPSSRRRFAIYWRIIYPGSALIRRMWLRAIARRAAAMA